ncbi:hypothetical protein GCM10027064_15860 [Microbacterium petrolearium]
MPDADGLDVERWIESLHRRLIAVEKRVPGRTAWLDYEHDRDGVQLEAGVELLEGDGRQIVFEGDARVFRGTQLIGPATLGDGVFINRGCFIQGRTTIGRNVSIGPGVQILTDTHELGPVSRRAGTPLVKPVRIGDGAWIGAGAIVLPGVTIGEGAVIAAGAVVTSNVQPSTLVAGVPATTKKRLASERTLTGRLRRVFARVRGA